MKTEIELNKEKAKNLRVSTREEEFEKTIFNSYENTKYKN